LDLDNEFGFAQIIFQSLIPAAQLLVLAGEWIVFWFRPPLLRKGSIHGGLTFLPPTSQRRRINTFPPQDFANLAAPRRCFYFSKNPFLISKP
jgi:hypothetical protein